MEMITNKDRVIDTLSKLPTLSNKELYALYPKIDQGSIRNYKHLFLKGITGPKTEVKNIEIDDFVIPEEIEVSDNWELKFHELLEKNNNLVGQYNSEHTELVDMCYFLYSLKDHPLWNTIHNEVVESIKVATSDFSYISPIEEKEDHDTLEEWPGNTKS